MKDITQKKYRERNVLGNSTEQPFIQERNSCKVIADIYIFELRGGKWQYIKSRRRTRKYGESH